MGVLWEACLSFVSTEVRKRDRETRVEESGYVSRSMEGYRRRMNLL